MSRLHLAVSADRECRWKQIRLDCCKNQPKDQFALRIPIDGDLKNPKEDAFSAFLSIFSNAFGKAFTRNTDGNVNFSDALRAEGTKSK